jgi:hypothetical protein
MLITYVSDTGDQITTSVIDTGHQSYIQISMSALIKKEKKSFLIYKEIKKGSGAKSCMTNNLLIYGLIFAYFLIY